MNVHTERHNRVKSHICNLCKEGFTRYIDLQKHVRKHNGETSFQCDICEVKFNSELELDVHVNTCEVENEHIKCYRCRKKIRKSYLKIHLKMHRDEKTVICEVCNKTFVNKSGLAKHQRIHTGDVI